jgi:3-hydroxyisobutyrate dehydrogenase-like beta-hydroxyacid dehydrogenase
MEAERRRETGMQRIGVIGAGLMGSAIAQRLLGARFEVLVYDVDPQKGDALEAIGAKAEASLGTVIGACEVCVLCVFNTEQVENVIAGRGGAIDTMLQLGTGGRVFIVTSTCDPDRLAQLAQRVLASKAWVVEVPISGTSRQVARGDGVGLVGGDRDVIEKVRTALDAICPRRHYLGAVGNGSRAKLAINLILGLNRAALAEGLVFAERLGLDPRAFLDVARGSAAYSQVMDIKGDAMARREYVPAQSRVDQSLKDFSLMLEQARARKQHLPFASVYASMMEDCVARGEGEWDNAAIAEAIARHSRE